MVSVTLMCAARPGLAEGELRGKLGSISEGSSPQIEGFLFVLTQCKRGL